MLKVRPGTGPWVQEGAAVAAVDPLVADLLDVSSSFEPRVVNAVVVAANADSASCRFTGPDGKELTGILPLTECPPATSWSAGTALTVVQVSEGSRPMLSMTSPALVAALVAGVSPEVRLGTVRVMAVSRRAGVRTKVAVAATVAGVDPVGACVGRSHNRVDAIKKSLGGEQVDIVAWHPDPEVFLARCMQPAAVERVVIDTDKGVATVYAPKHQMSAAVGQHGLNSILAGDLVGALVRVEAC